jgi:hypothetical protein
LKSKWEFVRQRREKRLRVLLIDRLKSSGIRFHSQHHKKKWKKGMGGRREATFQWLLVQKLGTERV